MRGRGRWRRRERGQQIWWGRGGEANAKESRRGEETEWERKRKGEID